MLRRSYVEKWNLDAVRGWAGQLARSRTGLMEQADGTRNHFRDIQADWKGVAYDAAYNRVGQDHEQVRKLALEIDELVTVVQDRINDVDSHRTTLLGKVADAQALGMVVDDAWKVMDYDTVEKDVRVAHQNLINSALWPFEDAVSKAAKDISEQAVEIRSAGDLLGSSLDVADADTQAARFGRQDGKALADAVRTGNQAEIDRITAGLPQPILTQFERDALAEGREVTTLPASTQDFYRAFFQEAGKDGILGLGDRLLARETAGDTLAAAQRGNLANSLLAISNDKVSASTGARGSFENLPPDLRQLISARVGDFTGTYTSPAELGQRYQQLGKLGELLEQASPGVQPGKQLGIELGRQSESMVRYVENIDRNFNGQAPPGFSDNARDDMDETARRFLSVATRNDDVSYSLLTGNGLPPSPDAGPDYKNQPFDADKFRDTIFRHEWKDEGKSAAGLLDWIAEDTRKPGDEGIRARQTLAELPDYFAPMGTSSTSESGRPELLKDGDKTVFQHSIDAFNRNPRLSDAMAHIMGNNIDSYISPNARETEVRDDNRYPGRDDGPAVLKRLDADRLLFLAGQSEAGRLGLEVSRQTYESAMIDRAFAEGKGDPKSWLDVNAPALAQLDGRITNATVNALTYQHENKISEHNNAAMETYENRQKAGEIIKSLTLDNLEIPGRNPIAVVGNEVFGVLKDVGYDAAMEKWNPEPTEKSPNFPNVFELRADANVKIRQEILESLADQGRLPSHDYDAEGRRVDFIGPNGRPVDANTLVGPSESVLNSLLREQGLLNFVEEYSSRHAQELNGGLARTGGDLAYYLTGKSK